MGMGRNILRGKALSRVILAALLSLSALHVGAASSSTDSTASAPAAAPGYTAAGQAVASDGPLPSVQGHEGEEVFTIGIPDEDIVGRYVDGLLATRMDWLQAVLNRSRLYSSLISSALAQRGLPRELGYLPAVESGFQARAVSPRGAAGLWQLMINTASPYGLRMDLWVDERRDVRKATEASLGKLTENYSIFGDWYLALAAYNCGVGRLSSILRRSPQSDFWDLRRKGVLPRETAAFVPQFLALCRILGHAGRYGLDVGWEEAPAWSVIALDRCVDLRILARTTGAPLDDLLSGNPELNFLVTPPASYEYQLKVPADYSDAVTAAVTSAQMPLVEFRIHVVSEGDTLYGMSLRYGVSVPLIQEFNPSLAPRALRLGSKILIPLVPSRSSG
jgi:membrane-bound lytic murein transglycosylase D